ncbi:sensor histidine kinase, partial [Paenibacillus sp. HJGM_3]|uniref:sensor histidine kinase n=1 Tax=Paenibacillus sp. HJGM_3 TaxID=3379816 RepID=UPI003859F684
SLDQQELGRFLQEAGWEPRGQVLLLDKDERIITGGNPSWVNRSLSDLYPGMEPMDEATGIMTYGSGQERQTILYNTIPNLGWKLVGFIPTRVYTAQNTYVLTLTAIATGVAIVLAIGLILYILQRLTKPLTKLTQYMKDLNPDDTIPTITVRSSDEVGLLVHSYNKLSDRIERLKDQVQLNEAKKKEADIQALQAQINPHFLYNTLSSIHWIALMNKEKQIAEMVGALSDFLRFSLNKGEEYCPVQQEIAHVQNYVHIQSMRFPDQFDVEFYIDPEMLPKTMLKLLLQPLIENSLIHGIQKRKERGTVFVHGELLPEAMRFTVEDTGVGIEPAKLQDIRRRLSAPVNLDPAEPGGGLTRLTGPNKASSYGLLNVHRRLQLHYGPSSGLTIDSEVGKGTIISFSIPLIHPRGERDA